MKRIIKATIYVVVLVVLGYVVYDNFYEITNGIEMIYSKYFQKEIRQTLTDTKYRKKANYSYLKINEDTKIKSIDDAKNAIYTMIDAGWDNYTIKCDRTYETCLDEVKNLINDYEYISSISNYVHPFNTITNIQTTFKSTGIIKFSVTKKYSEKEIEELEKKVDSIYTSYYDTSKNVKENIKIFRDYIIKNTSYDSEYKPNVSKDDTPSTAYGVLINGKGICSGYADALSLFLEKMHVNNFRISSETHEWNVVYVEGAWYHIDATWDDPTNATDPNYVGEKFFMLTHDELKEITDVEHQFNETIYEEAK